MTPEQRLANSAPRLLRQSPWDRGVTQEEVPDVMVENSEPGRLRIVRIWHQACRWLNASWRRRFAPSSPSVDAIMAALAYYDGRYQQRLPDPVEFQKLLLAWGSPDWPNPYPENSLPHYRIHPLGFLAADLEVVMDGWWLRQEAHDAPSGLKKSVQSQHISPPEQSEFPSWPTLEESESNLRQQEDEQRQEAHRLARVCWAMLMQHGTGLPHLRQCVHEDNLSMALEESLAEPTLETWGLDRDSIMKGAHRQGILPPRSKR